MTAGNQMIIGKNVVIHASATAAKLGEVNIFFGPVLPSTKTLTATTSITNGQVTDTGGGQLFVGTNLVQLNTPTNFLNAFGRNIILDTGTLPTGSILFFGGDTVTADPPPGAAGATAPAIVAMPPAMVVPMMNTFAAAASSTAANAFATTMTSQVANTLATTMTSPVANTLCGGNPHHPQVTLRHNNSMHKLAPLQHLESENAISSCIKHRDISGNDCKCRTWYHRRYGARQRYFGVGNFQR